MVEKVRKLPKTFQYFKDEDQFAGGVAFCAGCPLELTLRILSKVMGRQTVIVGTPSCSAPVLYGQNIGLAPFTLLQLSNDRRSVIRYRSDQILQKSRQGC